MNTMTLEQVRDRLRAGGTKLDGIMADAIDAHLRREVKVPDGWRVDFDDEQAKNLFAFIASEDDFAPLTLLCGPGHSGNGIYAALTEYPDEGATFIKPVFDLTKSFVHRATSEPEDEPPVLAMHPDAMDAAPPHSGATDGQVGEGKL